MKRTLGVSSCLVAAIAALAITYQPGEASDHDDGEVTGKARENNLTDHFAFRSPSDPTELTLTMYFNPRSLPGKQYFLGQSSRYEFHVGKIAARADAATGAEDFVFRFEPVGAPSAAGVQQIKLTVLKNMGGTLTEAGSTMGASTAFQASQDNNVTTNTATVGGMDVKWFVGQRADSFHFDVNRFFEVRAFLARRFFGGPGGTTGDANAALSPNCRGDAFLALLGSGGEPNADHDQVNLFNPPSCAPDFTKGLNVTAIVLNVKIAQLGGTIFDTWSTLSTLQAP